MQHISSYVTENSPFPLQIININIINSILHNIFINIILGYYRCEIRKYTAWLILVLQRYEECGVYCVLWLF